MLHYEELHLIMNVLISTLSHYRIIELSHLSHYRLSLSFGAMKKILFSILIFLSLFWACTNNAESSSGKPENDVDAASMFIRSALNGQWKEARKLIVQDSANIEDLEAAERVAQRRDAVEQRSYRESQITVHDSRKINDSTTVIIYSNTFKKQRDSVKAVRLNGGWLIDLKYSFPNTNAPQQ